MPPPPVLELVAASAPAVAAGGGALDERRVEGLRGAFPHYVGSAPLHFVNEAELAFARVLEEWGVAWEYEPRVFVLERDAAGRVTLAFRPDFYLPDSDLYIETTMMRQRLSRHKHRKLRLLRERFPDVSCIVLFRRDLERLGRVYGFELPPPGPRVPFEGFTPDLLRLAS